MSREITGFTSPRHLSSAPLRRNASLMLIFFPLVALLVIGGLYRDDLGLRAIFSYAAIWIVGLAVVLGFALSPGYFVVLQCFLAVAMLIHVRANPRI